MFVIFDMSFFEENIEVWQQDQTIEYNIYTTSFIVITTTSKIKN